MDSTAPATPSAFARIVSFLLFVAVVVALLEAGSQTLLARTESVGGVDSPGPVITVLNGYLEIREHVFAHAAGYLVVLVLVPLGTILLLRTASRWQNWTIKSVSGLLFEKKAASTSHPFESDPLGPVTATQDVFNQLAFANPALDTQVLVGIDADANPVWWTDNVRSMHAQLMGQTGSGKTMSFIYPVAYQDARRRRSTLFLSAKGARDDEQMFCNIAAASGRLHHFRRFTFDEADGISDTYNPLYLPPLPSSLRDLSAPEQERILGLRAVQARAVGERVFGTFVPDLDNPFYRDQARWMFLGLVQVLAATGKAMHMMDVAACLESDAVLGAALSLVDDSNPAKAKLRANIHGLGKDYKKNMSGLLAAVNRYDHPALNVYNPSIVLEDMLPGGNALVVFSLSANGFPFQARAIGQVVLQHLQQIGAARERLPSKERVPIYVYIDEVDQFAYEGLISAFNKLRSGGIALLIAHQSSADLEKISREFAAGMDDNTRSKIICYQSQGDLCDALSARLGTFKSEKRTNREGVDGLLEQKAMLESSVREVDEYVIHPNVFKNLRQGQARLLQMGLPDAGESAQQSLVDRLRRGKAPELASASRNVGVNLAMMKPLPHAPFPTPPLRDTTSGVGLYNLLVAGSGFVAGATHATSPDGVAEVRKKRAPSPAAKANAKAKPAARPKANATSRARARL